MSLATLKDVLSPAHKGGYAVPGMVVLGWEEACAYVAAAEAEASPVILQAGPSCREHTPLPILGAMFRHLAEMASVPVVAHLDHGYTFEECREALDAGFTSIMFDGSKLSTDENIKQTRAIADMAHNEGASCEGEIGFVGYASGAASEGTNPDDAERFAAESGVDAMAISVGNTHLQENPGAGLDRGRIDEIAGRTDIPLVIHGGSGVPHAERRILAAETPICKFNIGTELRMTFGKALREAVNADPARFDRVSILKDVHEPIVEVARNVIKSVRP